MTMISCNNQSKKISGVNLMTYNDWQKSTIDNVKIEKNLLDYQRENLIEILKGISKDKFLELKQLLLNAGNKNYVNTEYYLLELLEGELVTANLYYIIESNRQYKIAFINVYEEDTEAIKLTKSNSDIKKLIKINPISDDTLNHKIFILTEVNKNKVFSTIGSRW